MFLKSTFIMELSSQKSSIVSLIYSNGFQGFRHTIIAQRKPYVDSMYKTDEGSVFVKTYGKAKQ